MVERISSSKKVDKLGNFKPKGRQVKEGSIESLRQIIGTGSLKRELLIEYLHLIQDYSNYISSKREH